MARRTSAQTSWNFLRENEALRGAILHRVGMTYPGKKLSLLAKELNLNKYALKAYLEGRKPSLCNYDIIALLNHFGLVVDLDIQWGPNY